MDWITNLDGDILIWIQENLRNGILNPVMKLITHLGDAGIIWIVATIALLCFRKTRKIGVMSALALICSLIINNAVLKNLFHRVRPYEVVDGLKRIIEKQSDWSFPSGHTGSSFAAGVVMFRELPKKYGIPILVLAFLIAFSRLYVGVHYPTDVFVGMITGTISALIAIRAYNSLEQPVLAKLQKRSEKE